MARIITAAAGALLTLFAVSATATAEDAQGTPPQEQNSNVQVGIGVVCDTQEQVARFAKLSDESNDVANAIKVVNTEAENPNACAAIAAAFVRGDDVAEVQRQHGSVKVAKITIVAIPQGDQWQMIQPLTQYTAFAIKGISI